MNTYHWQIVQLDAKIQQDGKDNVIYTIHWRYTARDETQEYSATSIGAQGIEYKEVMILLSIKIYKNQMLLDG